MTRMDVRFVPSYKPRGRSPGFGTFLDFMVSDQIRRPLVRAAVDMVAVAKAMAPRSDDPRSGTDEKPHYSDRFSIQAGPMETLVFDGRVGRWNRHAMVQVSNDAPNAVPLEYGSGAPSEGTSGGVVRTSRQGGWNRPTRVLGRAGRAIGRGGEG